jgi:uncharacterized protein (DUF1697 family)
MTTTHIALLRGINVGGNKSAAMADLRDLLVELGFDGVESLLQSGNLAFQSRGRTTDGIERLLEAETAKRLGLQTDYFVRTASEVNDLVANNPFGDEAKRDPGHLVAMFLKNAPAAKHVGALENAIPGMEKIRVAGRTAYIVYPNGIGRSKVTNALIDRKLQTRGTGRNWNTVLKLAHMCRL